MKGVYTIARVRREFFVRGRSLKEISRDLHVSRNTVRKIVRSGETAFEYERRVQPRPKIGPQQDELDGLLSANAVRSSRERLNWMRIYEELRGLGYAASVVMVKALTTTEPPLRIVFYMMAMQCAFALVLTGGHIAAPAVAEIPWIVVVGISGLTAHYCMAKSVSFADASVVMPINFLALPVMAAMGYAFYGEGLDPYTLGGGSLVLGATYLNIVWARRRAAAASHALVMSGNSDGQLPRV
jgi:hypothetical protein